MGKEVLKQNSVVSSHPTFSNEANWNMVSYVFKHDSSSRRLVGSFKDFDSTKKAKLKTNMVAGDRFELHKIILATSPRNLLVLKRSQISGASGFDFDLLNDGPEVSGGGGSNSNLPNVSMERDFSMPMPSGWSEGVNWGAIVNNAAELYGTYHSVIFTHSFGGLRKARVFFDPSTSEVGMNLLLRSGQGGEYSYAAKSITLTEIQNGYFDTAFQADGPSGSAGFPAIRFDNTPTSGKFLRITKIQIGELV
jgi:hypothetical protein